LGDFRPLHKHIGFLAEKKLLDMSTDTFGAVRSAWYSFLKNLEIIRNYKTPYAMALTGPIPNPLLDKALSNTLTINLVSLLDESLDEFILYRRIAGDRKTLSDKIELLENAGLLNNSAKLHQLRKIRNNLAHTDIAIDDKGIDWKELDGYVDLVDSALQHLGMVADRPKYEFFFERILVEPTDEKVAISFRHRYGVRRDEREVLLIEYRTDHFRVDDE
jgi:hypothetical protein